MILLDTNVLSDALQPRPHSAVAAWLDAQVPDTLWVSTIALAEVRYGIVALPDGRRKERMQDAFERAVLPALAGRVLDFTATTAHRYATLMARARASGRGIGVMDGLIAATALEHRLAVATRDETPFLAVGLKVINPFTASA